MPVAMTAAPAAGGCCASQARKGEVAGMILMLRAARAARAGYARGRTQKGAGALSGRTHHAQDRRRPLVEDRFLPDVGAGPRSVDHHAVAGVDPDMSGLSVEEDQ